MPRRSSPARSRVDLNGEEKTFVFARRRALLSVLLAAGAALAIGAADGKPPGLPDPLDTPAQLSGFAAKAATTGIARQGDRLIAVGPRGLIMVSADAAVSWRQVTSPVSTDLVSVKFIGANIAWAVGHDAVALRSADAGATWQKALDGRSVLALLRGTYAARAKAGDGAALAVSGEIERSMQQSATKDVFPEPFLDVWFADANEGFLVGAFGLVLRTGDGGKTWEPWIERLDNERRFHLYAMTGEGPRRYIAAEQGLLLQLDAATQRFVKLKTPYNGTFFGIDVRGERLLVFGLRGNAYVRLRDDTEWIKIETLIDDNIVAALNMADGRLLLVSQVGHVLEVSSDWRHARVLNKPAAGEVLGAVAAGPKRVALARVSGVGAIDIAQLSP